MREVRPHCRSQLVVRDAVDQPVQHFFGRVHEDLAGADRLAVLHFVERVVLGEEEGCLGRKLLENGPLVVLADEGLVGRVVELVVVLLRVLDLQLGDVLEGGRKALVSCDVLFEVLAILLLLVRQRHHKQVAVYFAFPQAKLLVPLLQLLHLLRAPPQLKVLVVLPLTVAVGSKDPLGFAWHLN